MHKGEIVEEGDHDSLMRNGGAYFDLVEQQRLRKAQDDEQEFIFEEEEETTKILLPELSNLDHPNVIRERRSTVVSAISSVLSPWYRNRVSIADDNLQEPNHDEKNQEIQVIKK